MLLNLKSYHRPRSLDEAVGLLREGNAALLAGGTELVGRSDDQLAAVIDLSTLPLSGVDPADDSLRIGAMTTLAALLRDPRVMDLASGILARAIRQAAPGTIRAAATLGGTLAGDKGGDEIPTVLLALGARVSLATPGPVELDLADLLARRRELLAGAVLTAVRVPLAARGGFALVSRTPADRAIVCAAAVADRVAVGGLASVPRLLDDAVETWPAVADHRAGAEYRRWVAPVLIRRAVCEARGEVQV